MPPPREVRVGPRKPIWLHLTPLVLLVGALIGVLCWDAFSSGPSHGDDAIDVTQRLGLFFDYADKPEKGINNHLTFGLAVVEPANPKVIDKQLTFDLRGRTNSTVLQIDGQDRLFGNPQSGKWEDRPKPQGRYGGRAATFIFTQEQILATQRVEIIPGESLEMTPGVFKRLLDTCLVRYTLKNRDNKTRKVGVRVLLDTLIGKNDGVPFTIPKSGKLISTHEDFQPSDPKNKKPIPDFLEVLEFESLRSPGTIAHLNFRISDKLEVPGRVSLTNWPGGDYLRKYEIPVTDIGTDSAVVMYWLPADLEPGKTRDLGFSYGLGNLSGQSDKIALTFGGSFVINGELSVVALIAEPDRGQKATIEFPTGAFTLIDSPATQAVPPVTEKTPDGRPRPSPVTWRLRCERDGQFTVTVKTSDGLEAMRKITVKKASVF